MPVHLVAASAHSAAARLAGEQCGALSRRQLHAVGVPRWLVRLELRVGRWQRTGRQTVVMHNGPLDAPTRRWVAVLEAGPRAVLDGVSALQAAGLDVLTDAAVVVAVPRGARRRPVRGATVRETRRYRQQDVVQTGIPRTVPAVAALHAALWAASDRQATYLLTLVVQQGLCRPADLSDAATAVRRHPRRRLVAQVVLDLAGGSRSLGELDVARATEGRTVVRIPLVAWRLDEGAVLDALEGLFRSRGWRRPAA